MEQHDRDDPLHRYAFLREADHLWALGDKERLLACLRNREAYSPRENLERWRQWFSRLEQGEVNGLNPDLIKWARSHPPDVPIVIFQKVSDLIEWVESQPPDVPNQVVIFQEGSDKDDPITLEVRCQVAKWTGLAGDAREALRLSSALLPDQERVLGRDHPKTLGTRYNIAHWTGEAGDAQKALRLSTELLPDQKRVLGRDHPETLATRHNIAHWTGEVGDAQEALPAVPRAAAGPGAGAGPRPPRHAQDPPQHRAPDRRGGRRAEGAAAVLRTAAGPGAGAGP